MGQISDLQTLIGLRAHWRSTEKVVVWTNGCFDLLHAGHVRSLKEAKAEGDILIVGINSDNSVRSLKGEQRPIVSEAQRAEIVAAIGDVDYVVIFDDETPLEILKRLQPDVHCKGADYVDGNKPMPEVETVHSYGGRIAYLDLHLNCSTSRVIAKIQQQSADTYDDAAEAGMTGSEDEIERLPLSIVDRLSAAQVMVVGDVMLDEYLIGGITRISPEAPVPVIDVIQRRHSAGGAANVAANITALGAGASLIGFVADDPAGNAVKQLLQDSQVSLEGLVKPQNRHTICKTRLVAGQQQIARVDHESKDPVLACDSEQIVQRAARLFANANACILSDYAKGMLTEEICQEVIRLGREHNKPVIVDPKGRDFHKYRGCSVITPNVKEAGIAAALDIQSERDLNRAADILLQTLPGTSLLVTRGPEGMTLFRESQEPVTIPTVAQTVFDVVGAGDTAVATLAVAISANFTIETAIQLANIAAGIAVGKHGTVAVGIDELTAHAETFALLRDSVEKQSSHSYAGVI